MNELIQERGVRGSSRRASRSLLLIAEIALTFILVIGAGLMIKSFIRLLQIDLGFESERVLTFRSTLAKTRFPTETQALSYQNELLARLRALPNVKSAGVTSGLPMSGVNNGTDFRILCRPDVVGVGRGNARIRAADAGYFDTLGIRLVKGRFITDRDSLNAQRVVVVNQTLAQKFFPDRDPLGEQVVFAGPQPYTIVGVAADVKYNGLAAATPVEMYAPLAQLEGAWFDFFGRRVTFVAQDAWTTRKAAKYSASFKRDDMSPRLNYADGAGVWYWPLISKE